MIEVLFFFMSNNLQSSRSLIHEEVVSFINLKIDMSLLIDESLFDIGLDFTLSNIFRDNRGLKFLVLKSEINENHLCNIENSEFFSEYR